MSQRLSININDETAAQLRLLAKEKWISVTELVRRCVGLYAFAHESTKDGSKLALIEGNTTTTITML